MCDFRSFIRSFLCGKWRSCFTENCWVSTRIFLSLAYASTEFAFISTNSYFLRHKKDEFFLNRKRVQKSEVISLLESAGFSKSNPYYIVQQGKVSNLCVMKDKDRLELLKEVAGTTVYDERRAESLKIIQDSVTKQVQINVRSNSHV